MEASRMQEVVAALTERRKELETEGQDLQERLKACKREAKKCSAAIAALTDAPAAKKASVTREQMIDALRHELERLPSLSEDEAREKAVARLKAIVGTSRGWHLVIKTALRAIREEGLLKPDPQSLTPGT